MRVLVPQTVKGRTILSSSYIQDSTGTKAIAEGTNTAPKTEHVASIDDKRALPLAKRKVFALPARIPE
jgi:hypothetical protein